MIPPYQNAPVSLVGFPAYASLSSYDHHHGLGLRCSGQNRGQVFISSGINTIRAKKGLHKTNRTRNFDLSVYSQGM